MKAKLVVEGKEFDIEINVPELQELIAPKKQTGYERVKKNSSYYCIDTMGKVCSSLDIDNCIDLNRYDAGEYYSDEKVAENNARADMLMRQLRRFAVEHRESNLEWKNNKQNKYGICYGFGSSGFFICKLHCAQSFGFIPFDSEETAQLAINTFRDELIWYFTEYKDSL